MWSDGAVDVTLVEADAAFISCPLSNLVLGGSKEIVELTVGYDGLARRGVRVMHDTATAIDPEKRTVRLASGADLPYDRLVLSPASITSTTACAAWKRPTRRHACCMHGKRARKR